MRFTVLTNPETFPRLHAMVAAGWRPANGLLLGWATSPHDPLSGRHATRAYRQTCVIEAVSRRRGKARRRWSPPSWGVFIRGEGDDGD